MASNAPPQGITAAYNLLWIAQQFADAQESEQARTAVPTKTIESMLKIAGQNPKADVRFWIDSRRMTDAQRRGLIDIVEGSLSHNVQLHDLRTIPDYNNNPFYNLPDDSRGWFLDKHSLIWRQVDAAKVLICLQGNYDQVFYSDVDITNLRTHSDEVQGQLAKHGVIVSGGVMNGYAFFENQLFGLSRTRSEFFRLLYAATLQGAIGEGRNGYSTLFRLIDSELKAGEGIDTREIVFRPRYDYMAAPPADPKPAPKPATFLRKVFKSLPATLFRVSL